MYNSKNKEKWIEEILTSTDSINRAKVSPFLFSKILNRIKDASRSNNYIPVKRAVIGFITIILLAVVNVFVVFNSGNTSGSERTINTNTENSSQFIPSQYNPYLEILNGN